MNYIMESSGEADRLAKQALNHPVRDFLEWGGLRVGASALDVGCGPGVISAEMADIIGPTGSLVGVDANGDRIQVAIERCRRFPTAKFVQGSVFQLPFADNTFDYVWSQYLFQYLAQPEAALREVIRVTKRGGKIVISDIDGMGLYNYPAAPELEGATRQLLAVLEKTGFDLHVGRKLFSMFLGQGLTHIDVRLGQQYMIVGRASPDELNDWKVRFDALEGAGVVAFGDLGSYRAYTARFLQQLEDPRGLKYAPVLVTAGEK